MSERLPHLSALRAFEAAARRLSFRDAAEELGITASAISHQIRTLEAYLDVRLFDRLTRAVALTEAGSALYPKLDVGFRLVESAVREVRSLRTASALVVTAGPAIAAKWLVPKLYRFQEQYPGIELRVLTSSRPVDLDREDVDVAFRHGRGDYPGLESVRLFGEAYTPMCAPRLTEDARHPLRVPADLRHQRLLHDDAAALPGKGAAGWAQWLRSAKVRQVDAQAGAHFGQTDHAIQAAIDGGGVLLGRVSIAAFDLSAGRLVRPFELTLPSPFGYYFVTRQGRQRESAVAAFLSWIQAEAAATPGLPP
ncbi:transcriptional regulator GcvA [Variovorax paradoxus]|jgi:LysR family glycine cleavage system transcriptional activator|uniref:Glycine cleavage system transcriptional activator n=1 Tax=Variovorax paradoxus TaxID=34073 RepID=A0A679JSG8_VARPD|nr:Glycine cleavage system transcriptional activator [Variovorax paradoxus]